MAQTAKWNAEDEAASSRHLAELERLENSAMSGTQEKIAKNNLIAKQDMEDTARDNRQNNELVRQTEKLKAAGCLGKTDPKKYGF